MPVDSAGSCRRKRLEKGLRRALLGCLTCLLVAIGLRNWVARQAIERYGSHFLGAPVTVQDVDLGLSWITITGLRVAEPGPADETLLDVPRMVIAPSLAKGWREGVWLRTVWIDQPTVRLRLADDGSLCSRLPTLPISITSPSKNDTQHISQLPVGSLFLQSGRLVVVQAGIVDEVASGLELRLVASHEISLQAKIMQVLGGQFSINGKANLNDPLQPAKLAWSADGIQPGLGGQRFGFTNIQGEVDLRGSASVGVPQIADVDAWQAAAEVHLRRCSWDAWRLAETTIRCSAADGAVRVTVPAHFQSFTGECVGRAELEAVARLDQDRNLGVRIRSGLKFQHEPTSETTIPLQLPLLGHTGGTFSLALHAEVPLISAFQTKSWNASWTVDGRELRIADEPINDFRAPGKLANGRLEVPEFDLSWHEVLFRIGAHGEIAPLASLSGNFRAGPFRLADVAQLAEQHSQATLPLDGQAEAHGEVRLQLNGDWTAQGDLQLRRTRYSGQTFGDVSLNFKADRHGVELISQSADFLGGSYGLTAQLHELDWTRTTVTGWADSIRLKRLVELAGLNVQASGRLSGRIQCSSLGDVSSLSAIGQLRGDDLSISGLAVTLGHNELLLRNGKVTAQLVGECCDGKVQFATSADLAELIAFVQDESLPPLDSIPLQGSATLSGVSLSRLADGLLMSRNHHRIDGRLSASFVRDAQMIADSQLGLGSVVLERLSYHSTRLSDRITGTVALRSNRLRLDKLEGRLLDGQVRGQGEVVFPDGRPRGRLSVAAERVSLRRAASIWPSLTASGTASVQVQAKLDGNLTGRTDVSISNASVANVVVRHARMPIEWAYSPRSETTRWNCRGGTIEVGGGKAVLTSRGDYAGGLSTITLVRLDRIDTAKLLQNKPMGLGVIDGQVTVNARRATSLQHLQGKFDLELTKVQPLQVPILDQIPQLIQIPELLRPDILDDGGYLYGSFGGGVVRLEQLALWQNRIQILAEGEATLAGHLNLLVTASTLRGGPADQWLAVAQSPLMLAAPAPVVLLAQANELLKDRVIHVAVSGTASRPILRLQPARQLAQQALRFFIRGATGAQLANAADWNQRPRRR